MKSMLREGYVGILAAGECLYSFNSFKVPWEVKMTIQVESKSWKDIRDNIV